MPEGSPDHTPRDLRRYASQTNLRLVAGVLILLLVVGNGLIYVLFGSGAARASLLCMLGFSIPVILVTGILSLLSWFARRSRGD